MQLQIRQGDSLLTPFPAPSPAPVPHDQPVAETDVLVKKPLDFLLPFAVAANMNQGFLTTENLRIVTESLAERRSAALEPDDDENSCLLDFLIVESRLPFASDSIKPWHYQGWLLTYVILANAARPDVVNRWGWWAACHLEGGLIEEPIPHVNFHSEFEAGGKAAFKIINQCLEIAGRGTGGSWSAFTDFVDWLAWGLGVGGEKPRVNEATNEELYRAFNLEPFLTNPSDHLGQHLAEQKAKGWNPNAFYPTPHAVCEFMAQITFGGAGGAAEDERMMTVCDPAVGSGRQLLHASNYSVRLYGMDIDRLMVKICLINGAFFAPWMSFPFPHKWFERHDAARLQKPDEKFVLAQEHENKMLAAKILEKLKIKFSNGAAS